MTASNTRAVLAPYEGQLMHVKGRLKEVSRKPELDVVDILIVNCQFTPFSMDAALVDTPSLPGREHHLWQRMSTETFEDWAPELLIPIDAVGRVGQYSRNSGTVDWTVNTSDSLRLDETIHALMARMKTSSNGRRKSRLSRYRRILEFVDEGTLCWSRCIATNELIQWIRDEVVAIEADMAREALAPANGQCQRLKSIRLPGNTLQTAKGFA